MQNLLHRVRRRLSSGPPAAQDNDDVSQIVEDELPSDNYGARHAILLFVPVSICMIAVIVSSRNIDFFSKRGGGGSTLVYTPLEESGTVVYRVLISLANSLIFIGFVILATVILIILYKFRFYRVIHAWLVLTTTSLLFLFIYVYVHELFYTLNVFTTDIITIAIFIWNFGITGMMAIHWHGPLRLRQAYLVVISAILALVFYKFLPDWTGWFVLAVICIWDLIAVLSPCGPLRFLVKTAQRRNESIFPSLIYSSGIIFMANEEFTSATPSGNNEEDEQQIVAVVSPRREEDAPLTGGNKADKGVKLGLGDFIFYSILICKASQADWLTIACTFLAILIGLCVTLVLLAMFRQALPALPISITLGILGFFATAYVITPFSTYLITNQLFV